MMMNEISGRVVRRSSNRSHITVRMPRGGEIRCRNEGFRVGDQVCVITDCHKHVIRVVPKDVADLQVAMTLDPTLRGPSEEEYELYNESPRPERAEYVDQTNGDHRGQNSLGRILDDSTDESPIGLWLEDGHISEEDESREASYWGNFLLDESIDVENVA